jgi:hypothetical protein
MKDIVIVKGSGLQELSRLVKTAIEFRPGRKYTYEILGDFELKLIFEDKKCKSQKNG